MRRFTVICLLLLLLAGCSVSPAEASDPTCAPTTQPATEPEPTEDLSGTLRTGYYLLTGYDDLTSQELEKMQYQGYLRINPDRTGLLCMNGFTEHIDWTQTYLTISGGTCRFTIADDVMSLNYNYRWDGTFTYCGDSLPENYLNHAPEPGTYVLTLCVQGDDIYTQETPDFIPGYIRLDPDGTGVYSLGQTEYDLIWKNDTFLISSHPLIYRYYPADQSDGGIASLRVYGLEYDMMLFQAVDDIPADDY